MDIPLEDDERLVQMIQEFIESDSSSSSTPSHAAANGSFFSPSSSSDDHHSKYLALREILEEEETGAEAEVLETVMKHMWRRRRRRRRRWRKGSSSSSSSSFRDHHASSGLKKWVVLGLQIEGYLASLCQTSWVTSLSCPGGDYEYIDVLTRGDNRQGEHHRLIVDIDFKSQFEVARPTRTYKELTDILPTVFVGSESKLNSIISILCSAAKQSLKERGLHFPPWRTATYMQSKWLSPVSCRISSPAPSSSSSERNHSDDHGKAIKSKMLWAAAGPTNGVGLKGKRRDGSALSSEFSNMSINCC